jgi:methyl-accepting chemotaxis protein
MRRLADLLARNGLRVQLTAGFLVMLVIVLSVVGFGHWRVAQYQRSLERRTIAGNALQSQVAQRVASSALQMRAAEKDWLILAADPLEFDLNRSRWEEAATELAGAIDAYGATAESDLDQERAAAWRAGLARYRELLAALAGEVAAGRLTAGVAAGRVSTDTGASGLSEGALGVAQEKAALADLEARQSQDRLDSITGWAYIVSSSAVAISAFWVLFFPGSVIRPIRRLQTATSRLGSGDLGARADTRRSDELGLLAESFNKMAATIENQIGALRESQAEQERAAGTIRSQVAELERTNSELVAAAADKVARARLEEVVRRYGDFASRVAAGDLAARLEVDDTGDELAELGHSLNSMVAGLRAIAVEVKRSSGRLSTASTQILAAASEQATSASLQTDQVARAAETIVGLRDLSRSAAGQATAVAGASAQALAVARSGSASASAAIGGMEHVRCGVETMARSVERLAERSQAIGTIIASVREIADQSNLLALNAAIEAARAGEHGRGFAVVAQEVRTLAVRSRGATAEIETILGEIGGAAQELVGVAATSSRQALDGSRLAADAGGSIDRVAVSVEQGAESSRRAAEMAGRQADGFGRIEQVITEIRAASAESLTGSSQTEAAARELNAVAEAMTHAVAAYRT